MSNARGHLSASFHWDGRLLVLALVMLGIGLVVMTSASTSIAERYTGEAMYFFKRQLLFLIFGLMALWVTSRVPLEWWMRSRMALLLIGLGLLALVLIPGVGHTVNGSTRWLPLGPINLQVSEPARLLVLMYIASYLVIHSEAVRNSFVGFFRPLLFVVLGCLLLFMQPDFGAATVLLASVLALMFLGGVQLRYFVLLISIAAAGLFLLAIGEEYRMNRILSFMAPWEHQYDHGFQLVQALIAIGRGELVGVGLGNSVQKLFYLPEAHTDFVFAVLAEETGLVGASLAIGLFLLLVWQCFAIGRKASNAGQVFAAYLAYGIGLWLGGQAFINIGVNLGVLPTKGLTLPLFSYGGSSLITTLIAIGLLFRVAHESQLPTRAAVRSQSKQRRAASKNRRRA
ncbi:MAG: putative lipid II flippase FtsW [Gammaproteobacteria bacterium]|nr:putative lipid II flippase FtsW [Gammaproteobacteria bacterium]